MSDKKLGPLAAIEQRLRMYNETASTTDGDTRAHAQGKALEIQSILYLLRPFMERVEALKATASNAALTMANACGCDTCGGCLVMHDLSNALAALEGDAECDP